MDRLNRNSPISKQIKVNNTLQFLTECSTIFRENINAKIFSITGSCGKTTLKEMIGSTLKKYLELLIHPNLLITNMEFH